MSGAGIAFVPSIDPRPPFAAGRIVAASGHRAIVHTVSRAHALKCTPRHVRRIGRRTGSDPAGFRIDPGAVRRRRGGGVTPARAGNPQGHPDRGDADPRDPDLPWQLARADGPIGEAGAGAFRLHDRLAQGQVRDPLASAALDAEPARPGVGSGRAARARAGGGNAAARRSASRPAERLPSGHRTARPAPRSGSGSCRRRRPGRGRPGGPIWSRRRRWRDARATRVR